MLATSTDPFNAAMLATRRMSATNASVGDPGTTSASSGPSFDASLATVLRQTPTPSPGSAWTTTPSPQGEWTTTASDASQDAVPGQARTAPPASTDPTTQATPQQATDGDPGSVPADPGNDPGTDAPVPPAGGTTTSAATTTSAGRPTGRHAGTHGTSDDTADATPPDVTVATAPPTIPPVTVPSTTEARATNGPKPGSGDDRDGKGRPSQGSATATGASGGPVASQARQAIDTADGRDAAAIAAGTGSATPGVQPATLAPTPSIGGRTGVPTETDRAIASMQVKVTSTRTASAAGTRTGAPTAAGGPTGGAATPPDEDEGGPDSPVADEAGTSTRAGRTSARPDRTGSHDPERRASSDQPDSPGQAGLPVASQTTFELPDRTVAAMDAAAVGEGTPATPAPTPDGASTTGTATSSEAARTDDDVPVEAGASLLTSSSAPEGGNRLAISLHPKDLGAVQVHLDRGADGSVKVLVSAAEPGTLRSLMANQDQLHAALDAAAIPGDNRHLSFELAQATTTTSDQHAADGGATTTPRLDDRTMSDTSGFRNPDRQDTGQSQANRRGGFGGRSQDAFDGTSGSTIAASSVASTRRMASGSINITA